MLKIDFNCQQSLQMIKVLEIVAKILSLHFICQHSYLAFLSSKILIKNKFSTSSLVTFDQHDVPKIIVSLFLNAYY